WLRPTAAVAMQRPSCDLHGKKIQFKDSLFREQGQILMSAFIIIIVVELILRWYLIFQIRSEARLSCCEHFCILFFKQEYYLLWGDKVIKQETIDKIGSISDMFSIAYLAILAWTIYNGYSGIKSEPDTKKNFLIAASLVTFIALINVFKLLFSAVKICCGFTDNHQSSQPPPYSYSV
ncbi:14125_t:CDS:2, partial [Cetraspora pellucida]